MNITKNAEYFLTRDFSLWVWGKKIFASGTRLYVTDNPVQKPTVAVYPASKPESNGKTTLLCLARDMMPDLVKISWKMKDQNGQTVEVPQGEKEELEQREEGKTTSMIIIDKKKSCLNKYSCSVKHEGGNSETEAPKVTRKEPVTQEVTDDSFQSMCRLNMASLMYTVMILKSLVYCSGFALLLPHINMGIRSRIHHIYLRNVPKLK
ncbi:hypothetical protein UPYG_G00299480 [Umbra pygmaea]|uniref:Ig-like domain-containing protein n=1 Tax=Umbra pygmaea TaxID=75934 RepID=A0ABD0W7R7_UMBPY